MARREIALADYRDEQREAAGLFIDTGQGVFVFDPPFMWPDDFKDIADTDEPRLILTAVMGGEDRLDGFLAAGGTLRLGMRLLRDWLGLDPDPSPASSTTSMSDGPSLRPTSDASTTPTSSTPEPPDSPGDESTGT